METDEPTSAKWYPHMSKGMWNVTLSLQIKPLMQGEILAALKLDE